MDLPVYREPFRAGGGNEVRFGVRPGRQTLSLRIGEICVAGRLEAGCFSPLPEPPRNATRERFGPESDRTTVPRLPLTLRAPKMRSAIRRAVALRRAGPDDAGTPTGESHLDAKGRPRRLSKRFLVTVTPGTCVLFARCSCERRKEIQMR